MKRSTRGRWGWIGVGIVLALAFVVIRGCAWRPGTQYAGAHFNKGQNAAWLGVEWSKDLHSVDEIRALAGQMERHEIQILFVYASYLKRDGQFNTTYGHAADFVRTLKATSPETTVEAWIGIPIEKSSIGGHGYVRLSDAAVRAQIAEFCGVLVSEFGFDGVHLDHEPIPSGDQDVLRLLEQVRGAIGPDKTLSLATRHIIPVWSGAPLPPSLSFWRAGYYRQIAERVDEVAVMTYDSVLPSARLYEQWARFQVIGISRAMQGTRAKLLLGVPTSEEETWTHRPRAENMRSGLRGIIAGLNDAEAAPQAVYGVAIYPEWETSAAEWAEYDDLWLGR